MNHFTFITAACFILFISTRGNGQDIFAGYKHLFSRPLQYTGYQTQGQIRIDGELSESSWEPAAWSESFVDIEGDLKPAPAFDTRFKMLWDSQYLYIAAELVEPDIWATIQRRDEVVYYDNDFEIFIDPDGDTHNYFEIEVNAFNTIFDLFMPKPYRNGGPAVQTWDVPGLRSAVSIIGKINKKGTDKKWVIEMAIPFSSLSLGNSVRRPSDRDIWRINFSRIEWDIETAGDGYQKKKNPATNRPLPEHNWVWSPQGVVNMHMPERWGYLHFSTQKVGDAPVDLPLPIAEEYKKYLWLLYYKQQEYRGRNRQFASQLSQLNFPPLIDQPGINCSIVLEAGSSQFNAILQSTQTDEHWQINQDGKINKVVSKWSTKDNF